MIKFKKSPYAVRTTAVRCLNGVRTQCSLRIAPYKRTCLTSDKDLAGSSFLFPTGEKANGTATAAKSEPAAVPPRFPVFFLLIYCYGKRREPFFTGTFPSAQSIRPSSAARCTCVRRAVYARPPCGVRASAPRRTTATSDIRTAMSEKKTATSDLETVLSDKRPAIFGVQVCAFFEKSPNFAKTNFN